MEEEDDDDVNEMTQPKGKQQSRNEKQIEDARRRQAKTTVSKSTQIPSTTYHTKALRRRQGQVVVYRPTGQSLHIVILFGSSYHPILQQQTTDFALFPFR